jgi:hypothetical protein
MAVKNIIKQNQKIKMLNKMIKYFFILFFFSTSALAQQQQVEQKNYFASYKELSAYRFFS